MKRKIWVEVTDEGNIVMEFKYKGADYGLGVKVENITPKSVKGLYISMIKTIEALENRTYEEGEINGTN